MRKILLNLLLCLPFATAWTQVPEYDYFPASHCRALGIRTVTVYQSNVDSARARSTTGKSIRLAKNIDRQLNFDAAGRRVKLVKFIRGGAMVQQEINFQYAAYGLLESETLRLYHTNNADSTKLIQSREKVYYHDNFGILNATANYLLSGTKRTLVDSTTIELDSEARISKESVFVPESKQKPQLVKSYAYQDNKIVVTTLIEGQVSNRDEHLLRDQWFSVQELNFAANEPAPRLETQYKHDANDRLVEIRYLPDWKHFVPAETVVLRKNTFDKQGRLTEARLEYADGKATLELYDYSNETDE
ncbi:MAG: hypothetical protein IPP17_05810 [Bacteroidetes bacterium]|nr:hypothetical protein [Bacteroidota bacterium]